MSGVSGALVGAAVVGAGATAYAGSQAASAQKDANKANLKAAADTNRANLEMFYEGRGKTGFSLLPLYAKTREGEAFEPRFFADTIRAYDSTLRDSPESQLARNQEILARFAPAQAGSERTTAGLFDGSLEAEAVGNLQPVAQARRTLAGTKRSGALEALQRTLNDIRAIQSRKGFTGDTTSERLLTFQARRQAAQEGAQAEASAELENALDLNRVKSGLLTTRLQNYDLPYKAARFALDQESLPEDAMLDRTARRQQVFNAFRIGPGNFRYDPLPKVEPVTGTGQIVGQAVGQLAGSGGNILAAKYLSDLQQKNALDQIEAMRRQQDPTIFTGDINLNTRTIGLT